MNKPQREFYRQFSQHGTGEAKVVITAKERIARARVKRARLEKMRDKFLILSEDIGIKATDRLKALSMAYEIEKTLMDSKEL